MLCERDWHVELAERVVLPNSQFSSFADSNPFVMRKIVILIWCIDVLFCELFYSAVADGGIILHTH